MRIQNEDGRFHEIKERTYDLKSKGQVRMIQRYSRQRAFERYFDYNARAGTYQPIADTALLLPPIKEQMLTGYIKADDIVLDKGLLVHSKLNHKA